jgi:hypothetical protein
MLTDGREHVWRRSFFGANVTCAFCNLLPLDDEDCETECPGRRADCVHCGRAIVSFAPGVWFDPAATGDDSVWRETCDSHDSFVADHEPAAVTS